ncbi:MAG TPA: hypothetical protein VHR88_05205 [Solirubrobacteraceae bacterium]|jgi:hypothetical protein|nr:hypothetical protein [Solirubrobacteraceae bacterium]
MTALRAPLAVAAAAAALAVGAGCGGGGNDAYDQQVTKAAQQFRTDAQAASAGFASSGSATELRTAAARYRTATTQFEQRLRGLHPPKSVGDEQQQLITDLHRLSSTLDQVGAKVANADASSVKPLVTLATQLEGDVNRVSADGDRLQKAVNNS